MTLNSRQQATESSTKPKIQQSATARSEKKQTPAQSKLEETSTQNKLKEIPVQQQRDKQGENKHFSTIPAWTGFRGKTLWDWLPLLIIPILIAAGATWFNFTQTQISLQSSQRQHETDVQIAADQQREDVLVSYQKDISDLLLNYKLGSSSQGDAIRQVARAKTLTALRRLDPLRKAFLIQFLYEAQLITVNLSADDPIISLKDADLSGITLNSNFSLNNSSDLPQYGAYGYPRPDKRNYCKLTHIDLSGADLSGANLENADLSYAVLIGATLFQANLSGANLSRTRLEDTYWVDANLSHASLEGAIPLYLNLDNAKLSGTIMPDGSIYP